jgi:hypothetical protein
MKDRLPRTLIILFCLICAAPRFTEAQSFTDKLSLGFRGSILVFPEDNGLESDPMPVLPSLGLAAAYNLTGPLAAELSLDFYGNYYSYSYTLNRAVPANPENRSSFVIGSILGAQILGVFPLGDLVRLRAYGGPTADLRLCLIADGLEGEDQKDASAQTGDISSYFWGQGRWFLPVLGLGLDFKLFEHIDLGLDTRVWFPVYRLWTDEDLPPIEGWRFGIGFKITIRKKIKDADT